MTETTEEMFTKIAQERIYAIDILLGMIAEFRDSGNLEGEPDLTVAEFDYLENYLQQRAKNLRRPPRHPRKPRTPQARVQVADAPVKATFEPSDSYVNSMPKTGRNRP